MIEHAPEFVEAETLLYNTHVEHMSIIDARIDIAADEIKLSKEAFDRGYISKTEFVKSKRDHNRLLNENLKLHCKILTKSEQIKIESSTSEKAIWGKKVKLARIKAHINHTAFKPTAKMKEMAPELVSIEKELYDCNEARFKLLAQRESMLKENFKLSNSAFKKGVAAKKDMLLAKRQLDNFHDYRGKLQKHFERESELVFANLKLALEA